MLDFAEFVAINKFDRPQRAQPMRCAMWPSRFSATAKRLTSVPSRCLCLAPWQRL